MINALVPFLELVPKVPIQYPSSNLQQQVGALLTPAHMLFLDHPLAYDRIDGRFGKGLSPFSNNLGRQYFFNLTLVISSAFEYSYR